MKRILLLITPLLAIASLSGAQIRKSATLVGGAFQYLRYEADDAGIHEFSESGHIGISGGFAFRENRLLGLSAGFIPLKSSQQISGGDSSDKTDNRVSVGAFYRAYKPLVKNLYFFGQADLEGFFGKYEIVSKAADRNITSRQTGGSASFSVGISYQLFRKVQLEVSVPNLLNVQYLVRNADSKPGQATEPRYTQFAAGSSLSSFQIGFLMGGFRIIL